MTVKELELLRDSKDLPFPIKSRKLNWKKIIINHKIALPIEKHASYFKTGADISICDDGGNEIGVLVFTKELSDTTLSSLTENQFIAFLTEAKLSSVGVPYRFINNYLILREGFYKEYEKDYMKYSALWGGFYHPNTGISTISHSINISEIKLRRIQIPTNLFLENSVRSIAQPFGFERFLKLYHLLELRFDFDVIGRIKSLNVETESEKIGEILTDYTNSKKEIARLEDIVLNNCHDLSSIISNLNNAVNFQQISFDLFFKFSSSKEGNPLREQEHEFRALLASGFDEPNLRANKVSYQKEYRKFILKLACYWIYRIRSSIAHNKIGEYILSMKEEDFIVEFGEPLLREIILQCFKK